MVLFQLFIRWNFSVGHHEVNLAGGNCDSYKNNENIISLPSLHFVVPDGIICGIKQENNHLKWKQKVKLFC